MEDAHIKITDIQDVAEHVQKFVVEKPDGLDFKPGQYGVWKFGEDANTDKPFSFVTSPTDDQLAFATVIRDKSDFKQALDDKGIGDELVLSGPFGDFEFTGEDDHSVFVAGGIGITPFISMLRFADAKDVTNKITVLHSCKTIDRTPFKRELLDLVDKNDNIDIGFTLTQQEWNGPTGRIDATFINEFVDAPKGASWYVAGPPAMVSDVKTILMDEIQAEDVKTDEFDGY